MEDPDPPNGRTVSPAPPVVASSLLALSLEQQKTARTWDTGIKSLDTVLPKDLWRGGRVIGIAGDSGQLAERILATHLLRLPTNSPAPTPANAYIIAPHSTTAVSTLYSLIKSQTPTPLPLLSTVLLLQHLDLTGLTESLSEVSTHLFQSQSQSHSNPHPATLYIESPTPTLTSTLRRSGPTSTNALLSSLLRNVCFLSKTYPSLLVLLGVGVQRGGVQGESGSLVLRSAFANTNNPPITLDPPGALGRTFESWVDVLVLVHDPTDEEGSVVEVVKDREGGSLGAWGLWKR